MDVIYVHAHNNSSGASSTPAHPTRGAMSQSTSPWVCVCVCEEGERERESRCVQTTCLRVILGGLSAEQRHNKHSRNRKSFPRWSNNKHLNHVTPSSQGSIISLQSCIWTGRRSTAKVSAFISVAIKLVGVSSSHLGRMHASGTDGSGGVAQWGLGGGTIAPVTGSSLLCPLVLHHCPSARKQKRRARTNDCLTLSRALGAFALTAITVACWIW